MGLMHPVCFCLVCLGVMGKYACTYVHDAAPMTLPFMKPINSDLVQFWKPKELVHYTSIWTFVVPLQLLLSFTGLATEQSRPSLWGRKWDMIINANKCHLLTGTLEGTTMAKMGCLPDCKRPRNGISGDYHES